MIRLLISDAAFVAIAGCAPDEAQRQTGAGRYDPAPAGTVAIWLDGNVVEALRSMRMSHEDMSAVIIRYVEAQS